MKKLIVLSIALVFVFAMFIPQAIAKKDKVVKVDICHVIAANDVIPFGPVELFFGKVISVSPRAVDGHLGHGDFDCFWASEGAETAINLFREAGAHLPAANCYFGQRPNDRILRTT